MRHMKAAAQSAGQPLALADTEHEKPVLLEAMADAP